MLPVLVALVLSGDAGVCVSNADCPAGTGCACDIRMSCSWLRPGQLFGKPGKPVCLTNAQAIEAGAAIPIDEHGGRCGSGEKCLGFVPECAADSECPAGQVCICRGPRCSVQRRVWTYVDNPVPPYSTFMCLPKAQVARALDAGVTF